MRLSVIILAAALFAAPAIYGRRPIASSTTSASMVSAAPPFADSTVSTTPAAVFSAPMTLEPILNFMPCLASERWKCLATSPSMVGTSRSRYSTTVTCDPNRSQTDPSSNPI